ncbi:MAG: O-acetyl-ADP-ribose deacetylase [Thermoguttaceae bacterium]|jgi:O-acetyl-ADP-ribose deacetylase (regulator of RNase III)
MDKRYTIIDEEDRRFGPVDENTLRTWYHEGRITSEDRIYDDVSERSGGLREFFDLGSWEHVADMGVFLSGRVRVVVGDITKQHVDAIVNAANSSLLGGGGVDGAIHAAGGPDILDECKQIRQTTHQRGMPVGEAVITGAGNLSARHVIHTVGPVKGQHANASQLLSACYTNAIGLAAVHGCKTVAFPAISTGVYGYPRDEAAKIASASVAKALADWESVQEVRLVFYSIEDAREFVTNAEWPDQDPQDS